MLKRLCVITDRYPTKEYPVNTFLEQLVCQFADMGIDCTVVAPYSRMMDMLKHNKYHPARHYVNTTGKGAKISVYCPTIPVLTGRKAGPLNFARLYQFFFNKAVEKELRNIKGSFDAFYGHFIYPSGFAAVEAGRIWKKPSYIAYGECFIDQDSRHFSFDEIRKGISGASGIVAVSSKNREELIRHKLFDGKKIGVFPNAINTDRFYRIDRAGIRNAFGFDQQDFIVAFVGFFIDRKGVLRVSDALKKLPGVKSIFIGSGPQTPDCEGILFKGRVPHDKIVEYLNAADVFVLPTLAEGCCNAIIEAMACGLPIISSDLPFNDDILDESNSIRVDPTSTEAIYHAIETLYLDKNLRARLSEGAAETAKRLTIGERAGNILKFIERTSSGK